MVARARYCWLFVCALALFTDLAGCGSREFVEVEGTITLDGTPIEGIQVQFLPDPGQGNPGNTSAGFTDKNGRYRLHNGRDDKDGTTLGMHRVLLIDGHANKDPAGLANKPSRIPLRYADAGQTPLRAVEVKKGKQELNFDIESSKSTAR